MWTNAQLKEKAKFALKMNYWKTVFVSLIIAMLLGGVGYTYNASGFSSDLESDYEETYEYDEYEDEYYTEEDLEVDEDLGIAMAISIVLIVLAIFFVVFVIAMVISLITSAFIFNPIDVGAKRFFFKNLNQKAEVKEIAFVFDSNYMNVVKILFFRDLYTMLWSMLFIIPGIVKSYEYLMIPYLLAENPNLTKEQAFALSKQMMKGQKAEAWFLDLSFIGWHFLSAFTMGILDIFYVTPYKNLTFAALYEQLSYMNGRPAYGQPNMGNPNQQMNPYVQPVQQVQPVPPVPQTHVENNNTEA